MVFGDVEDDPTMLVTWDLIGMVQTYERPGVRSLKPNGSAVVE